MTGSLDGIVGYQYEIKYEEKQKQKGPSKVHSSYAKVALLFTCFQVSCPICVVIRFFIIMSQQGLTYQHT